jgi:2-polyprenyl-3-methyl-5-hydroxy-6-metoxy-1,4-benzoquinol methylase
MGRKQMDEKYWDEKSLTYNSEIFDVNKSDKNGVIRKWIKKFSSKDKNIGDLGCAIGKWLPLLSPHYKTVGAIDLSNLCLEDAAKRYRHLKNIEYLHYDLGKPFKSSVSFDVILCVNAIISHNYKEREVFFKNAANNLKKGGHLILVVPSFENSIYTEHVTDKVKRKKGSSNKSAAKAMTKEEVYNYKQGNIKIDGVPTKHYSADELNLTLKGLGFQTLSTEKVEYTWDTEIVDPPKWLKDPYPYDWMIVGKKVK